MNEPSNTQTMSHTSTSPKHLEVSTGQRFIQFWTIVVRNFINNRCPVRASALAYSNLLALVPVLAVVISVTSGFLKQDGQQKIELMIERMVATITPEAKSVFGHMENDPRLANARKEIASRIQEFIQKTRSGALGTTGVIALLIVGIGMLVRIENTFNDIWGITRGRTWTSRVVHYWAAMTLGPLLLVAAIALTGSQDLQATREFLADLPLGIGGFIDFSFRFLPFLILIVAFAGFYQSMPYTKVDWRASLVGGLVGGSLWQINNILSVFYASRIVTNSYIYGSLGLVPVVMIGLYFSWMILLFGAQVAYVFQNRRAYFQEQELEHFNHASRELIATEVMVTAARHFQLGLTPPSIGQLADLLSVPTKLITEIVRALSQTKLLVEVTQGETGYVPGRPPSEISCHDILSAMRNGVEPDPLDSETHGSAITRAELLRIRESEKAVAAHQSLADMVASATHELPKTSIAAG